MRQKYKPFSGHCAIRLCVLSASISFLSGCHTEKDTWTLETDYFGIGINRQGYITEMKNTTVRPMRSFSPTDKPSPLLSLYNKEEKTFYYPRQATFDKRRKEITLAYPNGSKARVKLSAQDKYIRLTLADLTHREQIEAIQWGPIHTNITNLLGEIIGAARDTSETVNYSIGLLALDDNTLSGTADVEGDAPAFQYIIHTPDSHRFPLPPELHEGQVFTLGGNGTNDVAFYAHREPYYRIMYGNGALPDSLGRISLCYQSRDRSKRKQIHFSLIPNMAANVPNHLDVEPIPGVGYIGSSVALWGSPDSTALLDVIQDIVRRENLPYPTVNGLWIKDPAAYSPDVMTSGLQYDSIISYTRQLGFPAIHAYDQGFVRPDRNNAGYLDGKDEIRKPFRLASGNLSNREYAEKAKEEGIMLGRVCITNALAPGTKDASPVPNDSLCYQQRRILARNMSASDTLLYIDDPTYMDEVAGWEGHCPNLNIVKIGNELIHYMGVTTEAPYRLLHVKRGYWGTKAEDHHAGDHVDKLQVTLNAGYDGLIPHMALQDKIAEYYADMARNSGITFYDFDGQEFLFDNGHGYYSVKRFFRHLFDRAQEQGIPYIRFSGATLSEGSWHYQSVWNVGGGRNLYDVDTREWGSTTSQGKDLRDVTYSNYFPVSFGGNFAITDTSFVEQYEHIEAISIGYGATYFLKINQKEVEKCPQKEQIFRTIRTWEDARHANAFPRHIRKMLMNPAYNWRLSAGKDRDSWTLHRMENGIAVETFPLKRAKGY